MVDMEIMRSSIANWLEKMAAGLEPGRFRFCARGSRVPTDGYKAQFATCFAVKIAWQTRLWDTWPEERKQACLAFIKTFQRSDGCFVDPWLARQAKPPLGKRFCSFVKLLAIASDQMRMNGTQSMNIRAETRQSASTLLMVGDAPPYPLPIECSTEDEVRRYVFSFDWTHPWSAGSHLSHLLFMLSTNQKFFARENCYISLIDTALECLSTLRDAESGCWFTGTPAPTEVLNGAMKVFSGLQWLDRPYPDCRRLLDFALAQPFKDDGCGFLNQLFVVYHAQKSTPIGYRSGEIQALGRRALVKVESFLREDGAFSFFSDRAQTDYYGVKVSTGNRVSDLHGTTMITWAIALATELVSTGTKADAAVWRIQSP